MSELTDEEVQKIWDSYVDAAIKLNVLRKDENGNLQMTEEFEEHVERIAEEGTMDFRMASIANVVHDLNYPSMSPLEWAWTCTIGDFMIHQGTMGVYPTEDWEKATSCIVILIQAWMEEEGITEEELYNR